MRSDTEHARIVCAERREKALTF